MGKNKWATLEVYDSSFLSFSFIVFPNPLWLGFLVFYWCKIHKMYIQSTPAGLRFHYEAYFHYFYELNLHPAVPIMVSFHLHLYLIVSWCHHK